MITVLGFSTSFLASKVSAYTITNTKVDPANDFILEPAKVDVSLDIGSSTIKNVTITSRIKGTTSFKVEVEDMIGTKDPNQPIILLGSEKSPYSFKDYLVPDVDEFKLDFGQKISIPVKIAIPKNFSPGGYYSALLITNQPSKEDLESGGARTVSRVGAEFFIRVKGEAKVEGKLSDFNIARSDDVNKTAKSLFTSGPFLFQVLFENSGNVHLAPYGQIEIKNIWGGTVGQTKLDAYFSMPNSLRYRSVEWSNDFMLGRYTATLKLNRSYDQKIDTQTIAFWVIPWKILLVVFGVILFIVICVSLFFRFFQLKK